MRDFKIVLIPILIVFLMILIGGPLYMYWQKAKTVQPAVQQPVATSALQSKPEPSTAPGIPTLDQLEAQLKNYQDTYPKLVEQAQQMQMSIIVLQGAIFREKQLKGIPVEPAPEPMKENPKK